MHLRATQVIREIQRKKKKRKKRKDRRETRDEKPKGNREQRTEQRGVHMNMKTRVWSGLGPGKTSTAAPTPVAEAEGAENIDKDETANSSSRESTTSDFSDDFCSGVYAI